MLSLLKLYFFSHNFMPCRHFWSVRFMSCKVQIGPSFSRPAFSVNPGALAAPLQLIAVKHHRDVRKYKKFSLLTPWAYFTNRPNSAASIAPTLIRYGKLTEVEER